MTPEAPLAPAWRAWLAENLLRGAPPDALRAELVARGAPSDEAAAAVDAVRLDPVLAGARRLLGRSAAVEQAARLVRGSGAGVREVASISPEELLHAHRRPLVPVVLRGGARGWPALGWTFDGLAARFGDRPVEVLVGRTQRWDWWNTRDAVTRTLPFREVLAIARDGRGDDVYVDARADLLARVPELVGELGLLPGLVGDGFPRLWVGPAGTNTPLHHDQSTGWLAQLVGTKRVWLGSPLEPALWDTSAGLYNTLDARVGREGEAAEIALHAVDLAPGDAVLLPVGWWHQVVATSPSISASFGGFEHVSTATWYTPGRR